MTTLAVLYERLGGEQGFHSIVDDFYRRVLADPTLAPFFSGVNMTALKEHQAAFLIMALGGPNHYQGRDMDVAHAGLKITSRDFYAVADHLVNALTAKAVDEDTIGEVVDRIEPLAQQIVNQPD
jgi:hemoglobin